MAKSVQEIATKWQQRMAAAGPAYAAGVQGTNKNPMQLAAAQASKAAANYQNAVGSGQWAAKLNATPIGYWKSQAAAAQSRLGAGAQKGAAKYTAAITALQPVWQQMAAASAAAGDDPATKAAAAINVLVAAGKKGRAASGG
jgi:hypothetical protein